MSSKTPENVPVKGPKPKTAAEAIMTREEDPNGPKTMKYHVVEINWANVEAYMSIGMDLKSCARAGGCHWNTLERRIVEKYGDNFRDVRAFMMSDRKAKAMKKMWDKVDEGDADMIKFVNRAFNGVTDKPKEMDEDNDDGGTFTLAYDNSPPPIDAEFTEVEDD